MPTENHPSRRSISKTLRVILFVLAMVSRITPGIGIADAVLVTIVVSARQPTFAGSPRFTVGSVACLTPCFGHSKPLLQPHSVLRRAGPVYVLLDVRRHRRLPVIGGLEPERIRDKLRSLHSATATD